MCCVLKIRIDAVKLAIQYFYYKNVMYTVQMFMVSTILYCMI